MKHILVVLLMGLIKIVEAGVVVEYHFDASMLPQTTAHGLKATGTTAPSVFGLVVSKAVWTPNGFIGGAYEFKGNGIIKAQGFSQPSETGEISLSVWIKPSITLEKGVKRNQFTSDCWSAHQFEYAQGGLLLELYNEEHRSHRYHYPVTLEKDKWYHLAFTAKAGHQVRMFINGDRVMVKLFEIKGKSKEGDPKIGSYVAPSEFDKQEGTQKKRLHIGAEGYNRWYFHGILDELTIWNTVVPPGQMKKLYKDQTERTTKKK